MRRAKQITEIDFFKFELDLSKSFFFFFEINLKNYLQFESISSTSSPSSVRSFTDRINLITYFKIKKIII